MWSAAILASAAWTSASRLMESGAPAGRICAKVVRLSSLEGIEVNNYHIFTILLVRMPFRKIEAI